ncbi:hypothetical protein [Segatella copri]|uniref:Uncharacterized protein n=1 Tax=Segatella copri TaxID=165179 RepID=A0AAW5U1E7_9BACT|nr:hypothetical protein [Segatella copri]MCW4094566.1 hypothetical protein [Segatella copri]
MGRCEVYRRISYEVCVVARKASQENGSGAAINNGKWIVGGLNATDKPLTLTPQSAYVRWQDCGISYRPAKETRVRSSTLR